MTFLNRLFGSPTEPASNLLEVTSAEECRALFEHDFVVIFKHSEACDLSQDAYRVVTEFCGQRPEVNIYLISVLDCRSAAVVVEKHTGVRHESPQVLALSKGTVLAHASHRNITPAFLAKIHERSS